MFGVCRGLTAGLLARQGFNGSTVVISCHGSRVVTRVIIYLASPLPCGVKKGQLTSASWTSAAHLGDGYRGYMPGAPCASIMEGMCSERGQWGFTARSGGSVGAAVPRGGVCTSGAASCAVTTLKLTGSLALGAAAHAGSH